MAVRHVRKRPSVIGHITLDAKWTGARSAGNPHAACDRAGAGNGPMASRTEASSPKGAATATGSLQVPRQPSTLPLPHSIATELVHVLGVYAGTGWYPLCVTECGR